MLPPSLPRVALLRLHCSLPAVCAWLWLSRPMARRPPRLPSHRALRRSSSLRKKCGRCSLRVPGMPRSGEAKRRAAARLARLRAQRGRHRRGGRPRPPGRQPAGRRDSLWPDVSNAAQIAVAGRRDCHARRVGAAGRAVGKRIGRQRCADQDVRPASACRSLELPADRRERAAGGERPRVDQDAGRSFHSRSARCRRAETRTERREAHALASRDVRSHWLAADARRHRCLPGRRIAERLRKSRRTAVGLARTMASDGRRHWLDLVRYAETWGTSSTTTCPTPTAIAITSFAR